MHCVLFVRPGNALCIYGNGAAQSFGHYCIAHGLSNGERQRSPLLVLGCTARQEKTDSNFSISSPGPAFFPFLYFTFLRPFFHADTISLSPFKVKHVSEPALLNFLRLLWFDDRRGTFRSSEGVESLLQPTDGGHERLAVCFAAPRAFF